MKALRNIPTTKMKAAANGESKKRGFLKELKNAVQQINLAKQGKVKLKSAVDILNEL